MATSLRLVDRGAWVSVNGTRELGISDLWRFTGTEFCDCAVADFLAEGFSELGVDSDSVEARLNGRCIQCGATGTTEWMTLGRIVDGDKRAFRSVVRTLFKFYRRRDRKTAPEEGRRSALSSYYQR